MPSPLSSDTEGVTDAGLHGSSLGANSMENETKNTQPAARYMHSSLAYIFCGSPQDFCYGLGRQDHRQIGAV